MSEDEVGQEERRLCEALARSWWRAPPVPYSLSMNLVMSLGFLGSAAGSMFFGWLCDRISCRDEMGDSHPDTLSSMHSLAMHLQLRGQLDEAETLFREVLEKRRTNMGASHPDTVSSRDCLSALLREVYNLQLRQVELGDGVRNFTSDTLEQQRDVEDASEQQLVDTFLTRQDHLGWQHPRTQQALKELTAFLVRQKRLNEAAQLYPDRGQGLRRNIIIVRHSGSGEQICEVKVTMSDLVSKLLASALEAAGREDGHLLLESEVLDESVSVKAAGLCGRAEVFLVAVREAS